jgi:hypothetical protein
MVQNLGTMDMFKELPENSRHCHAAPPLPPSLVALNQLVATKNALMQMLVVNEER